jgi:septal ring factor EnvC (AmiA/AmiB activator)
MKRTTAFLIFICLAGFGVIPALGQIPPASGENEENSTYKKKLETINGQIDAINTRLNDLKKESKSLLNDIYELELKYEKEVIESNKIKLLLSETRGKIEKKESEKKVLQQEIEKSKKNLKKIIRILYKVGGNSYLKIFIRVDSIDQLFKNYRFFMALIEYKSDELNKLKENVARLNKVKEQLQTEYSNRKALNDLKEQNIRNISGFKRGKLNLINKINTDKSDYIRLLDELKLEAARLDEVISGKKVKSSLRVIELSRLKGRLKWPMKGKVISSFGKKRSTRFNTYIIDNGIEIKPSGSDKITSVYSGDVVYAEYYKGYGNLIIVQHSRDLHSLYGHCKEFLKKPGDSVASGEAIAIAGDTGSTYGKSLYFEIRTNIKAQNPLEWLSKRR